MRTIAHLLLLILLAVLTACGATSPTPDPTATAAFGGDTASPGAESPPTDIGAYASGASDPATGLWLPIIPSSSRPASGSAVGTSAPVELPGPGGAVLAIAGELPLTLNGGECQVVAGDLYLNIPPAYDAAPPRGSLIVWAGDGPIRQGELAWAVSEAVDQSAITTQLELIEIELHSDGLSGQFYGVARQTIAEQPFSKVINVNGSFTCVSAPVRIAGEYPADLTGAQCSAGPFELRAGSSGQNAVVLVTTGNAQPGSSVAGGMTWRADGQTYITTSLQVVFGTDGVSGTFRGWAIGDGVDEFEVSGTFNCLGG